MELFIFLFLFSSLFLDIEALEADCPAVNCGHGGPDIRVPFRVKGLQPQKNCGHPSFELVCKGNNTIAQFSSYGDLVVKSISYDTRKLNLLDPKNCVHEVFLNLNLSRTPFHYYYAVKNYTYLNCSDSLLPPLVHVPCLSGSGHYVYTVESSLGVPASCRPIKTVAVPFSYSPYLSDNSFGLGLTWDLPESEDCFDAAHAKGFSTDLLLVTVLSFSIFILAVAMLISIQIYHCKKLNKQKQMKNQLEIEELLSEYIYLTTNHQFLYKVEDKKKKQQRI